jgi:hypothetical protein
VERCGLNQFHLTPLLPHCELEGGIVQTYGLVVTVMVQLLDAVPDDKPDESTTLAVKL